MARILLARFSSSTKQDSGRRQTDGAGLLSTDYLSDNLQETTASSSYKPREASGFNLGEMIDVELN
jgi:hypothetical protein